MSLPNAAAALPLSDNMKGSLLMVAAMAAFAVNDALVKFATAEIAPSQIMAVRGAMAVVLLFAIAAAGGMLRSVGTALRGVVLVRALADVAGTITFITALAALPLANATAILQALPIAVTLAAVVFLGERPGWRRWTAIAVGLVGVLVIIRPGTDGFTTASLLVVATVLFCTLRDIVTRKLPPSVPTVFVSGVTAVAVALFGAVATTFQGWQAMSATTLLAMALAACAIAAGYVSIVAAMRVGEVGTVAPFRYTVLLFAFVLSIVFFGEPPSLYDLAGSLIVVASGVYVIYRERKVRRAPLDRAVVR